MARPSIVPVTSEGKVQWFPNDEWRNKPLEPLDRIIIEKDMLGRATPGKRRFLGCVPESGEEVVTSQGTAWLASCNEDVVKAIDSKAMRVGFNESKAEVSSRFYNYRFKKSNHMLFDEVTLKGRPDFIVAKDSDLYIKADVKNFFTLDFTSSDIESKMVNRRIDSTTALAAIGFYLRVLFFKLTLDLQTDVAFFERSANIPMVMTLPVDASKRLHRKSGVLYSFQVGDNIDLKSLRVSMPGLNPATLTGEFAKDGLTRCRDVCIYDLDIPTPQNNLKLRIALERSLVGRGMFPWFVSDVRQAVKEMGWTLRPDLNLQNRVGIYFEVSQLPAGSHPWDFWISF